MHRLLKRQLDRLNLRVQNNSADSNAIDKGTLDKLLAMVSETYEEDDANRDLLQNSLKISSAEMRELYLKLQKHSEKRLEAVIAATPDLMFLNNEEGIYLDVFAKGKEDLFYATKEQCIGKNIADIFDTDTADKLCEIIKDAIKTNTLQQLEYELMISGEKKYFEARVMPTGIIESGSSTVVTVVRDITAEKERERMFRLSEIVFEEATEGIMISDSDRYVVRVNPAMIHILGIPEKDLLGEHSDFFSTLIVADVKTSIDIGMTQHGHWHGEIEIKHSQKESILAWLTMDAVKNDLGEISNFVSMLTDISEIRHSRDKMTYLATHDVLTGLPNRALLFDRLDHAIASMSRHHDIGALFFVDIDHFKSINDNYGHQIGDLLLQEFALRLKHISRESDTLGRLGGDEFLMIVEDIETIDSVPLIARKISALFETPLIISDIKIDVTLSIGIALFPEDGKDSQTLIHAADQAMYNAKEKGRNNFQFFSHEFSKHSNEYFMIQNALKQAISNDSFTLLYQPQFSLVDGSLTGIEALLRCHEVAIEDIPVIRLITIAEESGLIGSIGRFVLRQCCQNVASWQMLAHHPMRVAINLSRKELSDPLLVKIIQENLLACGLQSSIIEFEITESTLIQSNATAKENIDALRTMGCQFSIDDFGTGYSSLTNLKEFNFDKLKIDKSFIDDIVNNHQDQVIVAATISMAKKLGLTILAEGVEYEDQAQILREFECDEAQGYLFSRPVTADKITQMLTENKKSTHKDW